MDETFKPEEATHAFPESSVNNGYLCVEVANGTAYISSEGRITVLKDGEIFKFRVAKPSPELRKKYMGWSVNPHIVNVIKLLGGKTVKPGT